MLARVASWSLLAVMSAACVRSETVRGGGAEASVQPAATPTPTSTPREAAPPARVEAVATPAATAAHAAAQLAVTAGALSSSPLVHFVPVHSANGGAPPLQAFHRALRRLPDPASPAAEGSAPAKVRIAFYGASSVAADRYTAYLRAYLQARFGDAGPGFVAMVPLWKWHRHTAVRAEATKHWQIEHAQRKTGKLDGLYGLLGASAHAAHKRASAALSARKGVAPVDTVELWYLAQPRGGRATVTMLGKTMALDTAASEPQAAYLAAQAPAPTPASVRVKLKGDGEVRLFGATLERHQSGVVVDTLGIGGTRAANMVLWDEPMWREQLQRRAPALWVLGYGANEAVDVDEPLSEYEAQLAAVLARFAAAAPDASCVLVGPVDFPLKHEVPGEPTTWVERPRCTEIIEIQRRLAAEAGCGFFDEKAMMGGDGAMDAWARADPPLAKGDHLHFTPLGYAHLGRVLTDALMADYDDPPR